MHVAVGRLQLAVTLAKSPRRRREPAGPLTAAEKAYARRQLMDQVEADRQRWTNDAQVHGWWR